LIPSVTFQNFSDFPGKINDNKNPYLFRNAEMSKYNVGGYEKDDKDNDNPHDKDHIYYYTILKQNEHKYDWQENPIDNTIEDDFGVLSTTLKG
jgi:hypothetical protein